MTVQDESSQESDEDSDYNNQDLSEETSKGYTCNICKDPKCPRQKRRFKNLLYSLQRK